MNGSMPMIVRPRMITKSEELILAALNLADGSTARELHQRISTIVDMQLIDLWRTINEMVKEGLVYKQQSRPGTSPYWIEHPGRLALKRAVITTWVVGGTELARL